MSNDTRYAVNRPDVIDQVFEDEFVVVNLRNGAYYALKQTAGEIWSLLKDGASDREIIQRLQQEYTAAKEEVPHAVMALLTELEQEMLILPQPGGLAAPPDPILPGPAADGKPFTLPVIEKFTDMREVLQLDPIHEVDESGWPARKE